MTFSDMAKHTELSRAAARRFLLTLQELGYARGNRKFFERPARSRS